MFRFLEIHIPNRAILRQFQRSAMAELAAESRGVGLASTGVWHHVQSLGQTKLLGRTL